MKKNKLFSGLVCFICSLFMMVSAQATSIPLWTFTPLTPTTIQVPTNSTAIVQYTVTNMSSKLHTLMMVPISGITQITSAGSCPNPFVLAPTQSCTLSLQVNGNYPVLGGPLVCQQDPNGYPNPHQCYHPYPANLLNIGLTSPQVPTLYAGTQIGHLYYSINNGATWTATTPPAKGNAINSVVATSALLYAGIANGTVYSSTDHGNTWSAIATPAPGFAITSLYISTTTLYIASANGNIFICTLNGSYCTPTNAPAPGFAVNGIFVSANALYAASANGNVYYSNNNGFSWTAINGQVDGNAVNSVYVAANTLYVGTANDYIYTSTSLTGGGTWKPYAHTAYSLFVSADGSVVGAGTEGGYLYSLSAGEELGFVTYSPINSVFLLG
ncbi:putative protein related to plant photosystem II stability/assembly factor [Legionella massiliensis]|uniref:Uncharacterized protein n=1 Tax=Legionella massiliensis TaxID=1034943 RepID=A0A078KZW3_9GAMM|nr:hypothetical protein [Legionella massiliensis]CDZ77343.1 putative protein related to plant photosystem II stability/assembly factor [Legionella massiliensis]CEE13081.1 hypothetical protein BN1094_01626 [Legionella massiliensis]